MLILKTDLCFRCQRFMTILSISIIMDLNQHWSFTRLNYQSVYKIHVLNSLNIIIDTLHRKANRRSSNSLRTIALMNLLTARLNLVTVVVRFWKPSLHLVENIAKNYFVRNALAFRNKIVSSNISNFYSK